jgi:hypothetical protein
MAQDVARCFATDVNQHRFDCRQLFCRGRAPGGEIMCGTFRAADQHRKATLEPAYVVDRRIEPI